MELHFDLRVKVVLAFLQGDETTQTWVCVGISPNSYLAPDSICSFCIRDKGQAINQSCFMGFSEDTVDPSPPPFQGLG